MKSEAAGAMAGPALAVSAADNVATAPAWSKLADFVELTKPRIAILVLFTVAVGALVAQPSSPNLSRLAHALLGTGLVACGASALNQLLERRSDARMRRTENRPLPAGRLAPVEVAVFGTLLGVGGLAYLAVTLQHVLPSAVAAFTFLSYVFVYTPLKRLTTLNTLVGAIPGALPPVIGWTAMTGQFSADTWALFLLVFIWQVPHFLAIAWIYREDYARAGLKMLPVLDVTGATTSRQMALYCVTLLPVGLMPAVHGWAGVVFATGAVLLGAMFLAAVLAFTRHHSVKNARRVLHVSLLYLPAMLALWLGQNWLR